MSDIQPSFANFGEGTPDELVVLRAELARLRRDDQARRAASGQTRAAEALIRAILDSVDGAIFHIAKDASVIYANAHAREMPHLSQMELIGLSLRDFVPHTIRLDGSPFPYHAYPAIKCLATGKAQPAETIGMRGENGDVVWTSVSAVPFVNPLSGETDGVIATVIDISRSVQVAEALAHTEERYRRLVEDAPDAIIVHAYGPIVFANDAAVKLWDGESREDIVGREVFEFVHPRHRKSVAGRMQLVRRGATAEPVEHTNITRTGRKVRVEATAMPCVYDTRPCVQVILRDVTERTRTARRVRKQAEILRRFFDRNPTLVGFFKADGVMQMVNRQWTGRLGTHDNDTLAAHLESCYPDPGVRKLAAEHLQRADGSWRDFQVQVSDGGVHDISWASIELSDGTRIAIGQDVTRRKAAEAALRKYQAELERRVQERTEELSEKNRELHDEIGERRRTEQTLHMKQRFLERMLNTHERDRQLVAYEIHDTFLQGVIGALMFLDVFYDNQSAHQAAEMFQLDQARSQLRRSIDEARRMISGLRPPIIDEQGIVAAVEYLISEMNSRGLEIEFSHVMHVKRLSPLLEATIFRIAQEALTNFHRHSYSQKAAVALIQSDHQLRLKVQDWGVGFDPSGIGDRHFGLQGIRERTRLVGGSVAIVSQPGSGTTIAVEIPLVRDKNDE